VIRKKRNEKQPKPWTRIPIPKPMIAKEPMVQLRNPKRMTKQLKQKQRQNKLILLLDMILPRITSLLFLGMYPSQKRSKVSKNIVHNLGK